MGALKEIQKVTLDSDTNSVSLTGIDSTYNVYMVTITNLKTATDNKNFLFTQLFNFYFYIHRLTFTRALKK